MAAAKAARSAGVSATTSTERAALTYAAGGWLVLVAFYDRVMNLFWYPTLFADWLEDLLPDWLII